MKEKKIIKMESPRVKYKSLATMGPEVSGIKRCVSIPVFSRKESSEIKAYVIKCNELSLQNC